MTAPTVSVLMPVYNGDKFMHEAIDSIINQSYKNFEFIIINDGSDDNSSEIISSYKDSRIRLIDNKKNIGLVSSLNRGLDVVRGEYVARMDCDDISTKDRLDVQVKFMDKNKQIGASGSFYYLMRNKKKAIADFPLTEKEIECFLLFNSPIAHPTSILRMSLIKKNHLRYSSEYIHAEDYDLWSRISEYSELANIARPLLYYREHEKQITNVERVSDKKQSSISRIRTRHLLQLGINASDKEASIHNIVSNGLTPKTGEQFNLTEQWLKKLVAANYESNMFDKKYLQKIILERWLRLCFNFYKGKAGLKYFIKSDLCKIIKLPLKMKMELAQNFYYSWKRLRIK